MATTYNKTTQTDKTKATSQTTSQRQTTTTGGSKSKSYASGKVSANTLANRNKYGQEYKQSQVVDNAYQNLQKLQQNKPGMFSSNYQSQLDDIYDRILNREEFNFDVNENTMYQQLRDQYSALGKLAMQDTMGQAAAMTGGYGNSYAQSAGQQSYQNYMQQLQEQVPQLYQMELDRYNQEGDAMLAQYNLAKDMYNTDYSEYRDQMSDYFTERDYLNNQYLTERDFDYNMYAANRDYWNNEYWNERNSEQTVESSDWQNTVEKYHSRTDEESSSSSTNSSSSGESKNGVLFSSNENGNAKTTATASVVPLSNDYVKQVANEVAGLKSAKTKINYLKSLYNAGKLSEANLNYFLDTFGLDV